MTTYACPKGHQSQAGDYCDECGSPIAGVPAKLPVRTPNIPQLPEAAPDGAPCPSCSAPQTGRFCEVCGHDFVMAKLSGGAVATPAGAVPGGVAAVGTSSGGAASNAAASGGPAISTPDGSAQSVVHAASSPGGPAPIWRLAVEADADYHARMQAQREPEVEPIALPAFCPERRFTLSGAQALIGRQSRSRGIEPEIDLSGPPADPAVSHAHALLLAQADGGWAVVDLDSANGTYLNDAPDPIEPNTPTPIAEGDRVHVGAWTRITLQRVS